MKNNKGFSLVELIVVIALIAVLSGLVAISASAVLGTQVKAATKNIETEIKKARNLTMGKDRVVLKLYKADDGYYADIIPNDDASKAVTKKVGKQKVTVEYSYSTDGSDLKTLDSNGVVIEFDRSSGEVKKDDDGNCVRVIKITKNKTVRTITLYQETGKTVVK